MHQGHIRVGTYTGAGAAINVELGFAPDYVKVIQVTDNDATWEWFAGMTTTTKTAAAVANLASNGISAYAGAAPFTSGSAGSEVVNPGRARGFTAGTDLAASGKVYRYIAICADG